MVIISNFPQGGAKINGVVESYLAQAGQIISAGDFVNFVTGNVISGTGTKTALNTAGTGGYGVSAELLPNGKILVIYSNGSTYTYAHILTISNGIITVGAANQLVGYDSNIYLAVVSNTKILIIRTNNVSPFTLSAAYLTISDNTITLGSATEITSYTMSSIDTTRISDNRLLLVMHKQNTTYTYSTIITFDGVSISIAALSEINTVAYIDSLGVAKITDDKAILCYRDTTSTICSKAKILNISGNTINSGAIAQFGGNAYCHNPIVLSNTKVLDIYDDNATNGAVGVNLLTIAVDDTITYGAKQQFGLLSGYALVTVCAQPLANNKILVAYDMYASQGANNGIYTLILAISDSTITGTAGAKVSVELGGIPTGSIPIIQLSDSEIFIAYQDTNTTSNYFAAANVLTIPVEVAKATTNPFDGVAKISGAGGSTINVYTL